MLLEVLISILLFAVGILGTIALQAASIKHNSDAKYRIDASFLANTLVARMWTDVRTPATLATKYGGGGDGEDGQGYTAWLTDVQALLPGVSANPPTVSVVQVDGPSPPATSKSQVTTTVSWQAPGETVHQYEAITFIPRR